MMKCIIIPEEYQQLFPIQLENDRVEMILDATGNKVITEDLVLWDEFVQRVAAIPEMKEQYMDFWAFILTAEFIDFIEPIWD